MPGVSISGKEIQMKNIRSCLCTVVEGGVKEEIVDPKDLPKRAQKAGKYSGYDCFLLDDGRYAYRDYDPEDTEHNKPVFYHVLTIEDERLMGFLECLDYFDHEEERINRCEGEMKSRWHERYKTRKDCGEEEAEDPVETALYDRYCNGSNNQRTRHFPLPAEYAVIKCAIQQMTPADQRVYEMGYDSYLSDIDIKRMFELEHSAWTNEKSRFLEKLRALFAALGYDVPENMNTAEAQQAQYEEAMGKAIAEEEEYEAEAQGLVRELQEQEMPWMCQQ